MDLLLKAQKVLRDHSVELYNIYGEDIPLEKEEYKRHYSNLGEMLFEIDSIESFTDLISKLESNFFSQLGYDSGNEDLIEEFLKAVMKNN